MTTSHGEAGEPRAMGPVSYRWATPFTQALRAGDAQLVAAGYITQDAIAAALDATER